MAMVGFPVILGNVGRQLEVLGVGSRLDPGPEHLRAELVLAWASFLSLGAQ